MPRRAYIVLLTAGFLVTAIPMGASVSYSFGGHSGSDGTGTYTGTLAAADERREYRFEANIDDYIGLELQTHGFTDFDLDLIDPSGGVIVESNQPGSRIDGIAFPADETGVWTARVLNPRGESGSYNLSISVIEPPMLGASRESDIVIALLDSGIDYSHPEFEAGQIVGWRDFVGDIRGNTRSTPYDDYFHGTAVASLVGGSRIGLAPNVKLAVGKVLDHRGFGTWDAVRQGIEWASTDIRADIILLALGTDAPFPGATDLFYPGLSDAIREAHRDGSLIVVANGNGRHHPGETHAPAWSRYTFAIGSTNERGNVSRSSNPDPEVVAWGENVCTARALGRPDPSPAPRCFGEDTDYGLTWGSSFAAARVAGWAAELLKMQVVAAPTPSPDQLESAIECAAEDRLGIPYPKEGFGWYNDASQTAAAEALGGHPPCAGSPGYLASQLVHMGSDTLKFVYGDGGGVV